MSVRRKDFHAVSGGEQSRPSTSQRIPSTKPLLAAQKIEPPVTVLPLVTLYTLMFLKFQPLPSSATYNLVSSGEKQMPLGLCRPFVVTGNTVALPLVS